MEGQDCILLNKKRVVTFCKLQCGVSFSSCLCSFLDRQPSCGR